MGFSQLLPALTVVCYLPESLPIPLPGVMDDINITSYSAEFIDGGSPETGTDVLSVTVEMTWSPPDVTNGELFEFEAWLGVIPLVIENPSNEDGRTERFKVS